MRSGAGVYEWTELARCIGLLDHVDEVRGTSDLLAASAGCIA